MSFNPDPAKQAQDIIFTNTSKRNHADLMFNNNIVNLTTIHKCLGLMLDAKLGFDEHLKSVSSKISHAIGFLQIFQGIFSRTCLIAIYKSFPRPHLDYGDVIYDKTFIESFYQRLEYIQYDAAIPKTVPIRGTFSEKLY